MIPSVPLIRRVPPGQSYFAAVEVQLPQVLTNPLNMSPGCTDGFISVNNLYATQALNYLQIQTTSADVNVSGVNSAASSSFSFQTITGNIYLQNANINSLSVNTISGNVNLVPVKSTSLDISTTSGNIQTTGSVALQYAGFTTTSGELMGDIAIGSRIKQLSTSGDVTLSIPLTGTISTAYALSFQTTSGVINSQFTGPIAGSIAVASTSGPVRVLGGSVSAIQSTNSQFRARLAGAHPPAT
ncbi:uncharacterized protein BJ171DRAFT_509285 [Polychytrium aggregatum]|uniref:uncharacterized protein n=1 Tax=Polychytrium aggregatum TaxID=110093 RepID=UPI0022FDEF5B|nr:uncharacterized protein BJ171DRAFT_509285 [Polychytrium aggregatum]KAI9203688.1 hypothetical protein BJ171DRAFT_509285 [Polychytrium aggregatum]